MSVLRIRKKINPYTQIYNAVFEDRKLSYAALGILGYLLSKPPNWEVRMKALERPGVTGREAVRTAVNELITNGYIIRRRHKEEGTNRLLGWIYDVFEEPQKSESPSDGFPSVGIPSNGYPSVGKPSPNNKDPDNKVQNNKDTPREDSPTLASEGLSHLSGLSEHLESRRAVDKPGKPRSPSHEGKDYSHKDWLTMARADPKVKVITTMYPGDPNTPEVSEEVARKFVRRRQTILGGNSPDILAYALPYARGEGYTVPPWKGVSTYSEILETRVLKPALAACQAVVKERLVELLDERDLGQDTDVGMHQLVTMARIMESDVKLVPFLSGREDLPVAFATAFAEGLPDLKEAQEQYRDALVKALIDFPMWNSIVEDFDAVFGVPRSVVMQLQAIRWKPVYDEISKLQKFTQ